MTRRMEARQERAGDGLKEMELGPLPVQWKVLRRERIAACRPLGLRKTPRVGS